ncbi:hypothetical protein [Myxococcus sp. RHSTA-1-4]|uniref:hypothetical protein n=1 Tax=Myxococcus sp. RHSTA-1-4 TaxID=2874601 RepID=UPI001CBF6BE8|nr:hypothetical protein [Myxococcus sp. RHSTA-1-4]MBZ4415984.1 hypothetical protein [Myxococcus sp. RHSTA-1-4]
MSSTLESYELIRFAEAFEARLATAGEMLAGRPGLESEKRWLADALELVRTTRAPSAGVLDRVKDLPELEEAREEYAFHQQGLWVDALEKLHAGITFTASSRAPVIEALFPHVKFPQLRRAPRDAVIEYATSYERRTKSAYVTRIFARDDFALVRPVMEQVAAAHTAWRSSHEPAPLTPEVETVLREELVALGRKLDVALRQARLLSEAAVVPVPSVYEAAGLGLKPKRRAGRGLAPSADEALAGFGEEPVDSMEPTAAELAEVAALDAGGEAASVAPAGARETAPQPLDAPLDDGADVSAPGEAEGAEDTEAAGPQAGGDGEDATSADEASAPGASESAPAPTVDSHGATAPGAEDDAARNEASEASSVEPPSEPQGEARGARKGRKKAEAPSPPEGEAPSPSAEAQAPRVRKKKAAPAPGASGSDTP